MAIRKKGKTKKYYVNPIFRSLVIGPLVGYFPDYRTAFLAAKERVRLSKRIKAVLIFTHDTHIVIKRKWFEGAKK